MLFTLTFILKSTTEDSLKKQTSTTNVQHVANRHIILPNKSCITLYHPYTTLVGSTYLSF